MPSIPIQTIPDLAATNVTGNETVPLVQQIGSAFYTYKTPIKNFFYNGAVPPISLSASPLTWTYNSFVGVGISSPSAKLHIVGTPGDTVPELRIGSGFGAVNGSIDLYNNLPDNTYNDIVQTGDHAILYGGNAIDTATGLVIAPWMTGTGGIRVTGTGKVGIGKSNPTTALDVNGTVSAISFNGNLAGNAATSTLATKASTLANGGGNGTSMTFNWTAGAGIQPTFLWGGSDGVNMYIYNPSNLSVAYATSARSAATISDAGITASKLDGAQTGSAPIYGVRAWVKLNPYVGGDRTTAYKTGTYSRTTTQTTITAAGHGLRVNDKIWCDFTSGGGTDGLYTVTSVTNTSIFTVNHAGTTAISGNVTLQFVAIQGSGNISSASFYKINSHDWGIVLNFTTPMPHDDYATVSTGHLYPSAWWGDGAELTDGNIQLNTTLQAYVASQYDNRFMSVMIIC